MRRALIALSLLALAAAPAGPPPTAVEPVREVLHGVEVVDPYRWLEGSAAPEMAQPDPALDARVGAWTDAQNAYSRAVLDGLPGRKETEARLRALFSSGGFRGAPDVRGSRLFFRQQSPEQSQSVLMIQDGDGAARALVDPNLRDPSGLTTLAWFEPSPDGALVAVGLYRSGDENATLHLVETATGAWRPDEIRNKVREVDWLPDGSGFLYNNLEDLKNPYSRRIRFHRVGADPREDKVILEQPTEGPAASTWGPFGHLSADGHWMILGQWTGGGLNDVWVLDFRRWLETGKAEMRPILVGKKAQSGLPDVYWGIDPIVGNTFYMSTTLGALNRRVVAVDLTDPSPEHWREIVPERKDAALISTYQAGDLLALTYLHDASTRIELIDLDGKPHGTLPLPGIGSAELLGWPGDPIGWLTYTSFNEPTGVYRVDLRSGGRTLWWRESHPFDPASLEVKQVWYPSKDGTRISMFIVHRKGLKLDGCNPTILDGYGGFGLPVTPYFDVGNLPWLEDGGVLAFPNLRGGGEYGEAWHQAGMFEKKQNVFDDFLAAAEWLIANRYTKPERLGIRGASNGGLLMGAALTQRPDLFSAVIAQVPLMDMLRFHNFLRARNWVSEYGSSAAPEQFRYLLRYSPYQNVKKGTKYPAVLLTAGEQDERVHPLHARKMTALLQAATASDPAKKPILLLVDREAGHGFGAPVDKQLQGAVDQMAFFRWQLGMGQACGDRHGTATKTGIDGILGKACPSSSCQFLFKGIWSFRPVLGPPSRSNSDLIYYFQESSCGAQKSQCRRRWSPPGPTGRQNGAQGFGRRPMPWVGSDQPMRPEGPPELCLTVGSAQFSRGPSGRSCPRRDPNPVSQDRRERSSLRRSSPSTYSPRRISSMASKSSLSSAWESWMGSPVSGASTTTRTPSAAKSSGTSTLPLTIVPVMAFIPQFWAHLPPERNRPGQHAHDCPLQAETRGPAAKSTRQPGG